MVSFCLVLPPLSGRCGAAVFAEYYSCCAMFYLVYAYARVGAVSGLSPRVGLCANIRIFWNNRNSLFFASSFCLMVGVRPPIAHCGNGFLS